MPIVSVIIPCYNSGKTLLRSIQSVQTQTFQDIEIIVVNDGSTNAATIEVLKEIQKEIKIISQENKGLSSARNSGIRAANSKYILPLDSDDYLLPTFIEKAVKKIENNKDVCCIFTDMFIFGDREGLLVRNYNYFVQLFNNQLPYCLLFEKRIWNKIGGYDEDMKLGYEDWEFNIRLGKNGYHPLKIEEPLFYYNISSVGMLQSKSDINYIDILRVVRKKHRDIYSIHNLYKVWKVWKDMPKPFPLIFYILMYLATEYLPGNIYNYIYKKIRFLKQSERISD